MYIWVSYTNLFNASTARFWGGSFLSEKLIWKNLQKRFFFAPPFLAGSPCFHTATGCLCEKKGGSKYLHQRPYRMGGLWKWGRRAGKTWKKTKRPQRNEGGLKMTSPAENTRVLRQEEKSSYSLPPSFEALSFAEEYLKTREEQGKHLFQRRTRTTVCRFEQISRHQTTTEKFLNFLRSPQGLPFLSLRNARKSRLRRGGRGVPSNWSSARAGGFRKSRFKGFSLWYVAAVFWT